MFTLLLALLISFQARADILFIRLNPADGEIRAAREAAEKRDEKLIVIPEIDPKWVKRLKELDRLEAEYLDRSTKSQDGTEIEALSYKIVATQEERTAITKDQGLNRERFIDEMKKIESANRPLTSIIISGHDGNGKYWGAFAEELTASSMKDGFRMASKASSSIRSVALLGCYTTSLGAVDAYWKDVFPNVSVFGGYDFKGPLAPVAAGHKYLKDFLAKDQKLAQAKTKDEMLKIYKSLDQVQKLHASVISNRYIVSKKGVFSIEDLYRSCDGLSFQSPLRKTFECYYAAEKGCEENPKDTSAGVIRKFYEELQTQAHCKAMVTVVGDHSLPDAEVVLSMIFFDSVLGNFKRLHRQQLIELDQWLREMALKEIKLASFPANRAELMKLIRGTTTEVMNWGRGLKPSKDLASTYALKEKTLTRLRQIDQVLLRLDKPCVPPAWVDPLVAPTSSCMTVTKTLEENALRSAEKWSAQ